MNKLFSIVLLSFFLTGCGISKYVPDMPDWSLPSIPSFKPYKADVHQGSVLKRFTINQLKIGMSKQQVQDTIGQPSIIDPFHNNQWDYIHYTTLGSGEIIHYRLILTFSKEGLSNINTDNIKSLPEMTDKEKAKQKARIAQEKAPKDAVLIQEKTGG
ncbi:MAG: Outer membrane protein assembly factor BamE [Catillopecten margaritatus gill symbiont]|uniref:Outer membrane protein assembly factor BamE n=1 Tax=Catillopecten margaritatus gill symbiont TaxID=3083288 RepID=A0AAU6PFC0_9GAMM